MAGSTHIPLRHLLTACTVILGFLLAAPIARADCEGQALEQPFAQWGDSAHYTLVGDGDLTAGAAGWDLDGADLVADNEPWYVHGGDTPRALRLRAGDSATTPPICVSLAHPTMRFFLRNRGGLLGALTVEVVTSNGLALPIGVIPGPARRRRLEPVGGAAGRRQPARRRGLVPLHRRRARRLVRDRRRLRRSLQEGLDDQ